MAGEIQLHPARLLRVERRVLTLVVAERAAEPETVALFRDAQQPVELGQFGRAAHHDLHALLLGAPDVSPPLLVEPGPQVLGAASGERHLEDVARLGVSVVPGPVTAAAPPATGPQPFGDGGAERVDLAGEYVGEPSARAGERLQQGGVPAPVRGRGADPYGEGARPAQLLQQRGEPVVDARVRPVGDGPLGKVGEVLAGAGELPQQHQGDPGQVTGFRIRSPAEQLGAPALLDVGPGRALQETGAERRAARGREEGAVGLGGHGPEPEVAVPFLLPAAGWYEQR
ncbi:hypothetical protein SGLAM104S_01360 [Streptomyces glaucescens]